VNTTAFANDKIPVVASFSILGDLVSEVGGDHVDITTLVKANGDAHVYSPTPKDALAVRKAKLLLVNGLNFEGWMPRFLESAHFQGTTIVVSDGIDVIKSGGDQHGDHDEHQEHADHDDHHEEHADHDQAHHEDADHEEHEEHADHDQHADKHDHGGVDPHAWTSIINVKTYIKNIAAGLSQVDPENSKDYQQNAQAYLQKLDKLEIKLHAQIDTIPLSQRVVITPHNAFRYFGRDFKMEFMAPQGTSTESEASASDMAAIIKQIRKNKVSAVFMENVADNRMVQQISQETDAKIGGELFSGSLSDKQGPAPTYLKMMEYNVNTIVFALTK
ncbi:MAG: zinc ABC transporter substrate-binding protein, partial [Psychromonas sp.]